MRLDFRSPKRAGFAALVILACGGVLFFAWDKEPREPAKAAAYWFERCLWVASREGDPLTGKQAELTLSAFRRLGTNAFPCLVAEAFAGQPRSPTPPVAEVIRNSLQQHLGVYLSLPRNLTAKEVRDLATQLICQLRFPAPGLLPAVAGQLNPTNGPEQLRALDILGSAGNADARVVAILGGVWTDPVLRPPSHPPDGTDGSQSLRAIDFIGRGEAFGNAHNRPMLTAMASFSGDPDFVAQVTAYDDLASYLQNTDGAPGCLVTWLQAQNWQAKPPVWVAAVAALLERCAVKAGDGAPQLLAWLRLQDPNAPANAGYLPAIRALATIGAKEPDTLAYLQTAFNQATNWDPRLGLAASLLQIDAAQDQALAFLKNAWVSEINPWRWQQASNALARLRIDVRQWPEPVRLRPAPLARWLALGQGAKSPALGPSLKEWLARAGTREPEYLGQTLKQWLWNPDPRRLHLAPSEPVTGLVTGLQNQVRAHKTTCIPWVLEWLDTGGEENLFRAQRAFALLGKEGIVALPALVELAQGPTAATRKGACQCLSRIQADWDTLWLAFLPALHHPDPAVRVDAARYLCECFPAEARRAGVYDCLPLAVQEALPRVFLRRLR